MRDGVGKDKRTVGEFERLCSVVAHWNNTAGCLEVSSPASKYEGICGWVHIPIPIPCLSSLPTFPLPPILPTFLSLRGIPLKLGYVY